MKHPVVVGAIVGLLLALTACESFKKSSQKVARSLGLIQDVSDVPPPAAPDEYKRALVFLQSGKYEEALSGFDIFIRQTPASPYAQVANWNAGRALEELGRWTEAAERYRAVAMACDGVALELEAISLYRLSFASEALADDPGTVAVLHDLLGLAKHLPREIADAELPARLASAYARVGNFDEADRYYKRAEAGINILRRSHQAEGASNPKLEWLPRTLYFMGSQSYRTVSWSDFETAMRPLARGQIYLLQASEFHVSPWSERASEDLIKTYRELWRVIEMAPQPDPADPQVSARAIQHLQWDRAALLLQHVQELRARFLPPLAAKGQAQTGDLGPFVSDLEKKIAHLLELRPVGDGPTEESRRRQQGLHGQVISPDSSLEQRYLETSRRHARPEVTAQPPMTLPAVRLQDKTVSPPAEVPSNVEKSIVIMPRTTQTPAPDLEKDEPNTSPSKDPNL